MAVRKTAGTARKAAPVKKKSVKRKAGIGWKGWLLIAFAALIGLLLILAALIFSPMRDIPPTPPAVEDAALQSRLLARISGEVIKGKPKESELILTPADVASLIRLSDNGFVLTSGFTASTALPPRYYEVKFANRRFDFVVPVDTGWRILFGGVIRLSMEVEIEKEGDEIDFNFSKFRAGRIPLPTWLVRDIALKELGKHRQDRNFLRFNRPVKSLFCDDDGNLHIVYRPGELRTVFLGF